jgi:hypothetical protein
LKQAAQLREGNMTDIVFKYDSTNVCTRYGCDFCDNDNKTNKLVTADDPDTGESLIMCEHCLEHDRENLNERLERQAEQDLIRARERVRRAELRIANYRTMRGRLKLLTYSKWSEQELGEFEQTLTEQISMYGGPSLARKMWQENEPHYSESHRAVFAKFIAMTDEDLIRRSDEAMARYSSVSA